MDKDANSLANRIAMLESEESKILKKIEHTRRRAQQILDIKKSNEERYTNLMKAEQMREVELKHRQMQALKERKVRV